ncbi:hypothetical protein HKX48_008939 [Thoreauomyces humboldtii]|nr:hypothetical protein HKX48_008939 [Thoreauomyces humboldtii]
MLAWLSANWESSDSESDGENSRLPPPPAFTPSPPDHSILSSSPSVTQFTSSDSEAASTHARPRESFDTIDTTISNASTISAPWYHDTQQSPFKVAKEGIPEAVPWNVAASMDMPFPTPSVEETPRGPDWYTEATPKTPLRVSSPAPSDGPTSGYFDIPRFKGLSGEESDEAPESFFSAMASAAKPFRLKRKKTIGNGTSAPHRKPLISAASESGQSSQTLRRAASEFNFDNYGAQNETDTESVITTRSEPANLHKVIHRHRFGILGLGLGLGLRVGSIVPPPLPSRPPTDPPALQDGRTERNQPITIKAGKPRQEVEFYATKEPSPPRSNTPKAASRAKKLIQTAVEQIDDTSTMLARMVRSANRIVRPDAAAIGRYSVANIDQEWFLERVDRNLADVQVLLSMVLPRAAARPTVATQLEEQAAEPIALQIPKKKSQILPTLRAKPSLSCMDVEHIIERQPSSDQVIKKKSQIMPTLRAKSSLSQMDVERVIERQPSSEQIRKKGSQIVPTLRARHSLSKLDAGRSVEHFSVNGNPSHRSLFPMLETLARDGELLPAYTIVDSTARGYLATTDLLPEKLTIRENPSQSWTMLAVRPEALGYTIEVPTATSSATIAFDPSRNCYVLESIMPDVKSAESHTEASTGMSVYSAVSADPSILSRHFPRAMATDLTTSAVEHLEVQSQDSSALVPVQAIIPGSLARIHKVIHHGSNHVDVQHPVPSIATAQIFPARPGLRSVTLSPSSSVMIEPVPSPVNLTLLAPTFVADLRTVESHQCQDLERVDNGSSSTVIDAVLPVVGSVAAAVLASPFAFEVNKLHSKGSPITLSSILPTAKTASCDIDAGHVRNAYLPAFASDIDLAELLPVTRDACLADVVHTSQSSAMVPEPSATPVSAHWPLVLSRAIVEEVTSGPAAESLCAVSPVKHGLVHPHARGLMSDIEHARELAAIVSNGALADSDRQNDLAPAVLGPLGSKMAVSTLHPYVISRKIDTEAASSLVAETTQTALSVNHDPIHPCVQGCMSDVEQSQELSALTLYDAASSWKDVVNHGEGTASALLGRQAIGMTVSALHPHVDSRAIVPESPSALVAESVGTSPLIVHSPVHPHVPATFSETMHPPELGVISWEHPTSTVMSVVLHPVIAGQVYDLDFAEHQREFKVSLDAVTLRPTVAVQHLHPEARGLELVAAYPELALADSRSIQSMKLESQHVLPCAQATASLIQGELGKNAVLCNIPPSVESSRLDRNTPTGASRLNYHLPIAFFRAAESPAHVAYIARTIPVLASMPVKHVIPHAAIVPVIADHFHGPIVTGATSGQPVATHYIVPIVSASVTELAHRDSGAELLSTGEAAVRAERLHPKVFAWPAEMKAEGGAVLRGIPAVLPTVAESHASKGVAVLVVAGPAPLETAGASLAAMASLRTPPPSPNPGVTRIRDLASVDKTVAGKAAALASQNVAVQETRALPVQAAHKGGPFEELPRHSDDGGQPVLTFPVLTPPAAPLVTAAVLSSHETTVAVATDSPLTERPKSTTASNQANSDDIPEKQSGSPASFPDPVVARDVSARSTTHETAVDSPVPAEFASALAPELPGHTHSSSIPYTLPLAAVLPTMKTLSAAHGGDMDTPTDPVRGLKDSKRNEEYRRRPRASDTSNADMVALQEAARSSSSTMESSFTVPAEPTTMDTSDSSVLDSIGSASSQASATEKPQVAFERETADFAGIRSDRGSAPEASTRQLERPKRSPSPKLVAAAAVIGTNGATIALEQDVTSHRLNGIVTENAGHDSGPSPRDETRTSWIMRQLSDPKLASTADNHHETPIVDAGDLRCKEFTPTPVFVNHSDGGSVKTAETAAPQQDLKSRLWTGLNGIAASLGRASTAADAPVGDESPSSVSPFAVPSLRRHEVVANAPAVPFTMEWPVRPDSPALAESGKTLDRRASGEFAPASETGSASPLSHRLSAFSGDISTHPSESETLAPGLSQDHLNDVAYGSILRSFHAAVPDQNERPPKHAARTLVASGAAASAIHSATTHNSSPYTAPFIRSVSSPILPLPVDGDFETASVRLSTVTALRPRSKSQAPAITQDDRQLEHRWSASQMSTSSDDSMTAVVDGGKHFDEAHPSPYLFPASTRALHAPVLAVTAIQSHDVLRHTGDFAATSLVDSGVSDVTHLSPGPFPNSLDSQISSPRELAHATGKMSATPIHLPSSQKTLMDHMRDMIVARAEPPLALHHVRIGKRDNSDMMLPPFPFERAYANRNASASAVMQSVRKSMEQQHGSDGSGYADPYEPSEIGSVPSTVRYGVHSAEHFPRDTLIDRKISIDTVRSEKYSENNEINETHYRGSSYDIENASPVPQAALSVRPVLTGDGPEDTKAPSVKNEQRTNSWISVVIAVLALFAFGVAMTILHIAGPVIARGPVFGPSVGAAAAELPQAALIVTVAGSAPIWMWSSTILKPLRPLTVCIAIFAILMAICAGMSDWNAIIALEAMAGLGAGGILPLAFLLVQERTKLRHAVRNLVLLTFILILALFSGALIGHSLVLTSYARWTWVFLIPALIAIPAFLLCLVLLKRQLTSQRTTSGSHTMSLVPATALGLFLAVTAVAIIWGAQYPIGSATAPGTSSSSSTALRIDPHTSVKHTAGWELQNGVWHWDPSAAGIGAGNGGAGTGAGGAGAPNAGAPAAGAGAGTPGAGTGGNDGTPAAGAGAGTPAAGPGTGAGTGNAGGPATGTGAGGNTGVPAPAASPAASPADVPAVPTVSHPVVGPASATPSTGTSPSSAPTIVPFPSAGGDPGPDAPRDPNLERLQTLEMCRMPASFYDYGPATSSATNSSTTALETSLLSRSTWAGVLAAFLFISFSFLAFLVHHLWSAKHLGNRDTVGTLAAVIAETFAVAAFAVFARYPPLLIAMLACASTTAVLYPLAGVFFAFLTLFLLPHRDDTHSRPALPGAMVLLIGAVLVALDLGNAITGVGFAALCFGIVVVCVGAVGVAVRERSSGSATAVVWVGFGLLAIGILLASTVFRTQGAGTLTLLLPATPSTADAQTAGQIGDALHLIHRAVGIPLAAISYQRESDVPVL